MRLCILYVCDAFATRVRSFALGNFCTALCVHQTELIVEMAYEQNGFGWCERGVPFVCAKNHFIAWIAVPWLPSKCNTKWQNFRSHTSCIVERVIERHALRPIVLSHLSIVTSTFSLPLSLARSGEVHGVRVKCSESTFSFYQKTTDRATAAATPSSFAQCTMPSTRGESVIYRQLLVLFLRELLGVLGASLSENMCEIVMRTCFIDGLQFLPLHMHERPLKMRTFPCQSQTQRNQKSFAYSPAAIVLWNRTSRWIAVSTRNDKLTSSQVFKQRWIHRSSWKWLFKRRERFPFACDTR